MDGFLKVIDINNNQILKSFKICSFCLSCITTLKDSELFGLGSWDNKIYLFNVNYGSKIKTINAHNDSISDLVYLKKKQLLISSSWDCTLRGFKLT